MKIGVHPKTPRSLSPESSSSFGFEDCGMKGGELSELRKCGQSETWIAVPTINAVRRPSSPLKYLHGVYIILPCLRIGFRVRRQWYRARMSATSDPEQITYPHHSCNRDHMICTSLWLSSASEHKRCLFDLELNLDDAANPLFLLRTRDALRFRFHRLHGPCYDNKEQSPNHGDRTHCYRHNKCRLAGDLPLD